MKSRSKSPKYMAIREEDDKETQKHDGGPNWGRHLISFYAMQSLDFGDYLNLAENVLWKCLHCNA